MTDDSDRIDALDFLRGIAVLGFLPAAVMALGLPPARQFAPFAPGGRGALDAALWLFNFLFVDGKVPALFAMVFGASILLVMEAVELSGRDGLRAHRRRMLWLGLCGIGAALFLWSGSLLLPLAAAGLIATAFAGLETLALIKWALGLLALQWAIDLGALLVPAQLPDLATVPLVSDDAVFGHASYLGLVADRLGAAGPLALGHLLFTLPGLMAFVALGMAMLKGGFLAGQWTAEQYRATWRRAYLVGLLPMAGLAAWVLLSGGAAARAGFAWAVPLALPLAAAHAALALELAVRFPTGWPAVAVRSVGRLALTNGLLASAIFSALFLGFGAGSAAWVDRPALMLVALAVGAAMLIWSPLWMRQFRAGPAEWLGRRLCGWKV